VPSIVAAAGIGTPGGDGLVGISRNHFIERPVDTLITVERSPGRSARSEDSHDHRPTTPASCYVSLLVPERVTEGNV